MNGGCRSEHCQTEGRSSGGRTPVRALTRNDGINSPHGSPNRSSSEWESDANRCRPRLQLRYCQAYGGPPAELIDERERKGLKIILPWRQSGQRQIGRHKPDRLTQPQQYFALLASVLSIGNAIYDCNEHPGSSVSSGATRPSLAELAVAAGL